jgi:hypothetical protein
MKKTKILKSLALSTMMFFMAVIPSFAATNISIWGNGSDSDNRIRFSSNQSTSINQSNNANFDNNIRVFANTGGSEINRNTGGWTNIRTGDSNANVEISNNANFNWANIGHDNHDDNIMHSGNHDYDDNDYDYDNKDYSGHNDYDKDAHGGYDDNGYNKDDHEHDYDKHDNHNGWDDKDNHGHNIQTLYAGLTGNQEVPHHGDPDGVGHATLNVNADKGELCIHMHNHYIDPATAAHIHKAPIGQAGPIVVPLPTPDATGHLETCVSADKNVLTKINQFPTNFYVNVHNNPFPEGALRGQLSY